MNYRIYNIPIGIIFLCFQASLLASDIDRPSFPKNLYQGPISCIPTVAKIRSQFHFVPNRPIDSNSSSALFTIATTRYFAKAYQIVDTSEIERCRKLYPRHTEYCHLPTVEICSKSSFSGSDPTCTTNPDFDILITGPGPEGGFITQFQFNSRLCQFYVGFLDNSKIELTWRYLGIIRNETFDLSSNFIKGFEKERPLAVKESWGLQPQLIAKECSFSNLEPLRAICQ